MGEEKSSGKRRDAAGAATLIMLITVLLIFYIVFLPPNVRIELLGEDASGGTPGSSGVKPLVGEFLLRENVGHLSVVNNDEKTIDFPNFVLTETKPDILLREVNTFQIYHGWFSELRKIIPFSVPKEGLTKVHISFQAPTKNGILVVGLNGAEIFRGRAQQSNLLSIDPGMLDAEKNQLTFNVEGGFFESQEYQISDLKIIATVEEKEALISHNPFSLEESELQELKEGKLRFFISCDVKNTGYLTVSLNSKQLYSAVPVCDDILELNVYQDYLKTGRNVLSFEGTKGVYDISKSQLLLKLKETKPFLAYFNINNQLYSDVLLDKFKKIILQLDFVDDGKQKELELNINGQVKSINQKETKFEWVLSDVQDLLLPGKNYIEVTPVEPVDVVELRIKVE
ncbi:hypothetical protein HZA97_09795 [Candidatus Woesearchaeota archaeon]|nr:hypothetical protein [Candidatus Woesearchaeota archaeon]